MIEIDGSYGEGGGSIVRLSVALSALTQKPLKIVNIRAKRKNGGLRPQHLASINAVKNLCDAQVTGNFLGSKNLEFFPKEVKGKDFEVDIGTAGSITLVLQALMLASLNSTSESNIKIKGGTHTLNAPTMTYLDKVTIPLLRKLGFEIGSKTFKYGFYPKGGGEVEVKLIPSEINPLILTKESKLKEIAVSSIASMDLKEEKVAEKMLSATDILRLSNGAKIDIKTVYVPSETGASVDIVGMFDEVNFCASSIYETTKEAEFFGNKAKLDFARFLNSNAPIDKFLADQILPYLVIATEKGESEILVEEITKHTETNMWLLKQFINVDFTIKDNIIKIKKGE